MAGDASMITGRWTRHQRLRSGHNTADTSDIDELVKRADAQPNAEQISSQRIVFGNGHSAALTEDGIYGMVELCQEGLKQPQDCGDYRTTLPATATMTARDTRWRWRRNGGHCMGTAADSVMTDSIDVCVDTGLRARAIAHEGNAAACALKGLCPRSKLSLFGSARMLQAPELAQDFASVMEGGAHHLKNIFGSVEERRLFDQLRAEIEDTGLWRKRNIDQYERSIAPEGGQRSTGRVGGEDASTLAKLPAHRYVLEHLVSLFDVQPLAWWINVYSSGRDSKAFHKDKFVGQNITIGASFGATRNLTFRHGISRDEFHFSQENGDVFAFRDRVNSAFLHGMHPLRSSDPDPGTRISVIVMGRARGRR
eukprot:TRINITY_DN63267_c0_g1_i1.p1 TRINITY_DN63267_c0_g1~~TRINITY_DN63267_c0_g1_i1.p1  ORF type:complete len:401 (-),score=48.94 TRINITY_DN63267_c0_g1_i1:196-1296(-)